jgi:PAS domain S-box-containing protein
MKPFATGGQDGLLVLAGLLDVIQDGLVLLDRDLTIVWANRWMEERYAAKAPLAGKKCFDVFNHLTGPRSGCPYLVCLDTGDVQTDAFAYPSPEEPIRRFEMLLYRHEDGEGKVTGVLGHIKDMTELRQAEDVLRDEMSRGNLLVRQSSDGIVILDDEGAVFEANLEFAHMLGYTMEEMRGLHVWDWECQYSKEEVQGMLKAVDENGDHVVSRHSRKDGSTYEVEISTNGTVYLGKKYIFCVCRDVTQRNRSEREREALIGELQAALAEIKALRGILPLCSYCKRIRIEGDQWEEIDVFIQKHSEANVSHGICPECMKERHPELSG